MDSHTGVLYHLLPNPTVLVAMSEGMQAVKLMLMTHAPETGARNWRQKTGVGFWRRFFTPVAKFLAPETNTDE